MRRAFNVVAMAMSIAALSTILSLSGLGQAAASAVRAGVQRVSVTNTVKVAGAVSLSNGPKPGAPDQPVEFSGTVSIPKNAETAGSCICFAHATGQAYTVPPGKSLVIEYATVDATGFGFSDKRVITAFRVNSGPLFFIPLQAEGAVGVPEQGGQGFHYDGASATRVYAEAGQAVNLDVAHEYLLDPVTVSFSFSGYLVNR